MHRYLRGLMAGGLSYLANTEGVNRQHVSAMGLSLGAFMTVAAVNDPEQAKRIQAKVYPDATQQGQADLMRFFSQAE